MEYVITYSPRVHRPFVDEVSRWVIVALHDTGQVRFSGHNQ